MQLDLLPYAQQARHREVAGVIQLWCPIRRSWLVAQPEEYVRQGLLIHLAQQGYPLNLVQVERRVGRSSDRLDLLVLTRTAAPFLLCEVKAPGYALQPAINQLSRYNRHLKAPYVLAVNGLDAICCSVDLDLERVTVLDALPVYPSSTA